MRIQDFIFALMFFIASSLVVLGLVFDVYGTRGYNIDLSQDNSTDVLTELQTKANEAQAQTRTTSNSIWDKTVGQVNATFESGSVTEGDMIKSSVGALTNIGDYVEVFTSMIAMLFSALGLGGLNSPVFWFLSGILVISIGLLLISSVLRNYI